MSDKQPHEFIPAHAILNDKEVKAVLEKLNLRADNLPKILSTDPQLIKLGAKPGNVVMVGRRDRENKHDYYRFVVEG